MFTDIDLAPTPITVLTVPGAGRKSNFLAVRIRRQKKLGKAARMITLACTTLVRSIHDATR